MVDKFKTLLWFLKDRNRWLQAWYAIKFRYFPHPKEDTRQEAEIICAQQAISSRSVLVKIGLSPHYTSVNIIYPEILSGAEERCQSIPVTMGGAGNIDLLYQLAEYSRAIKVVETGVAYGWSSLALLLSMQKRTGARLISIDMPYAKMNNEDYVGIAVPESLKANWKLIRKADRAGLPKAIEELGSIDLCHYDSDKSYVGRLFAYPQLWKSLRPGGIFVSDDVQDNVAFFDFARDINQKYWIVEAGDKYVGVMKKSSV